jgi:hypothetical protein
MAVSSPPTLRCAIRSTRSSAIPRFPSDVLGVVIRMEHPARRSHEPALEAIVNQLAATMGLRCFHQGFQDWMITPRPEPLDYVSRADLAAELSILESSVDEMVRRGVLPRPTVQTSEGPRWSWKLVESALALFESPQRGIYANSASNPHCL